MIYRYKQHIQILIALCFLCSITIPLFSANQLFVKKDIITKRFTFENKNDLKGWDTEKGSIDLSSEYSKEGKHSVIWKWKKGSMLILDKLEGLKEASGIYEGGQPEHFEPAFFKKGHYGGIKVWFYREKPVKETLVFQVGNDKDSAIKNPKYRFEINLDFSGWRAVWVQFEDDAPVKGYKGSDEMNSIAVIPSENSREGEIYIDLLQMMKFVSEKRHSDYIFKNNKSGKRVDTYKILGPAEKLGLMKTGKPLNSKATKSFKIIEKRLEYLILGEKKNSKKKFPSLAKRIKKNLQRAESTLKKADLKRKGRIVKGQSLFSCRDEQGVEGSMNYQKCAEALFFPLALEYKLQDQKDVLQKLYDAFDYFIDQGWAEGSALGTVDHVIRLNGIASAIFLLRKELATTDRLKEQQGMLSWHTRIGSILEIDTSKGENTDLVRGGALPKLISILVMKDSSKKAELMRKFRDYINYVSDFAPGYSDTIKPDYSIYHHRGTYLNAYGVSAVNVMAMMNWLLDGTEFALSKNSQNRIIETLKMQYKIAAGLELHPGVCGRFPYKNTGINRFMLPGFAYMAMEDEKVENKEMAYIFNYLYNQSDTEYLFGILVPGLTYSGTFGTLDLMKNLNLLTGKKEAAPPEGNFSLPYSSLSVHRRKGWVATVKGWSKYIWDYETGHKGENNLGRYVSHGALFLFAIGPQFGLKNSGMDINGGFHWGYLPGATTKALPIEKVYRKNKAGPKYLEGKHRSFTEETFSGGMTFKGRNGMFAMVLKDSVAPDEEKDIFDDSFKAIKSYFFFNDEIVCLGSDIANDDKRYDTITTLFQNKLNTGLKIVKIDSKETDGGMLTDPQGVYYIIPKGNKIILEQGEQKSLTKIENNKYEPISVPHVKAWIGHGKAPKKGEYEYLIYMGKNKSAAKQLYNNKSYSVLEKNNSAHIVKHHKMGIIAYALFKPLENIKHGVLKRVDTPVMVMVEESPEELFISIANPDLNLKKWNHNMSLMPENIVNAPSTGRKVSITLRDRWKLDKGNNDIFSIKAGKEETKVLIFCKDGFTREVKLKKLP